MNMETDKRYRKTKWRCAAALSVMTAAAVIVAFPAWAAGTADIVNMIVSRAVTAVLYMVIGVLNAMGDLMLSVMAVDIRRLEDLEILSAFETFNGAVRLLGMSLAALFFLRGMYSMLTAPLRGKDPPETPARVLMRGIFIPLSYFSKDIFLFLFEKVQGIYTAFLTGYSDRWEGGLRISFLEDTFGEPVFEFARPAAAEGAAGPVAGAVSIILSYALILIILWNFLSLILEITQRFVILLVYVYLSPLAIACGGSRTAEGVLLRSAKVFLSGSLLYILNVWVVGISLSLLSFARNGGLAMTGTAGMTIWAMVTYGFIKAAQRLDDIFSSVRATNPRLSGDPVSEILGMRGVMARGREITGAVRAAIETVGRPVRETFFPPANTRRPADVQMKPDGVPQTEKSR